MEAIGTAIDDKPDIHHRYVAGRYRDGAAQQHRDPHYLIDLGQAPLLEGLIALTRVLGNGEQGIVLLSLQPSR
jgi:hypothetical protein